MENSEDEKKEIIRTKANADLARFSSSALVKWGLNFQKVTQKQALIGILRSIWDYCKIANSTKILTTDFRDDFCESKEIKIDDVIHTFETPIYQRIAEFSVKTARLLVALGDTEDIQDEIESIANSKELAGRTRMKAFFILALIGKREWAAEKIFQIMKNDEGTGYGNEFDKELISIEPLPENPYLLWKTKFCELRFEYWEEFVGILGKIGCWTGDLFYNVEDLLESDLFGINTNGYSHLHKSIFNKRQEEKLNIDKNLHSGHKILDGLDLLKLFRGMQVSKVPREMRAVVSGYFDISELEQKTIDTLIEYARVILHKQYDDEGVPFGFHNQIVCALFLCCIPSTRHEGVTKLGVKKLTDVYSAIREIDPPSKIFECISALGYDSLIVDTLIDIVKQDLALDIKLLLCLEITTMLGEKND